MSKSHTAAIRYLGVAGILISACVSVLLPYVYYLLLNVKLDATISLVSIFILSSVLSFGFANLRRSRGGSRVSKMLQEMRDQDMQNLKFQQELNSQSQRLTELSNAQKTMHESVMTMLNNAKRTPENGAGRGIETVEPAVGARFCGNCGSRLTADDKFCRDCGHQT